MLKVKPKKKLADPAEVIARLERLCGDCGCNVREHSLGVYDEKLSRYTITCACGKCREYWRMK